MSGERRRRIKRALAAVFGAAAVLVVLYILRPPCFVRKVFGVLCPSCGTTRMIAALLQLEFAGAWALNPFMLFFCRLRSLGRFGSGAVCKEQTAAAI